MIRRKIVNGKQVTPKTVIKYKELIMFIRHSRRGYIMPEAYHGEFTRVQEGHMRLKEKCTKYIGNGAGNERVLYDSP
jgi:hypothetical protein